MDVVSSVTVNVSSGTKTVRVEVESSIIVLMEVMMPPDVTAPPLPMQVSPLGQQPYSPLGVRSQYVPRGQPPAPLGQHVAVKSIQPPSLPQAFFPCSGQGTGTSWRGSSSGLLAVLITATDCSSKSTIEGYMRGLKIDK